jgi:hypothetical protein
VTYPWKIEVVNNQPGKNQLLQGLAFVDYMEEDQVFAIRLQQFLNRLAKIGAMKEL